MSTRNGFGTIVRWGLLATGIASGVASASTSPAERCAASQLKAVGKLASASLACHAATATTQHPPQPCVTAAMTAFEKAWSAAETKGVCVTTASMTDAETEVAGVVDAEVGELTGTPEDALMTTPAARACAARKLAATGKDAKGQVGCAATAAGHAALINPKCETHATGGLMKAFATAEAVGGCATTGDEMVESLNVGGLDSWAVTHLPPPLPQCGTYVRQMVLATGSAFTGFTLGTPAGVAVDGSGNTYVTDSANNLVWKFDSSGNLVRTWGGSGNGLGQFNFVSTSLNGTVVQVTAVGLAVDSAGNVYVPDNGNARIEKFDSNGTFLLSWGSPGTMPGQFEDPLAAAVNAAGNVDVLDAGNVRVDEFNGSGTFVRAVLSSFGSHHSALGANAMAVDGKSDVFVDTIDGDIAIPVPLGVGFNSTGAEFGGIAPEIALVGIAVPPDGTPFFTGFAGPLLGQNPQVLLVDGSSLSALMAFGTSGTGNGQFTNPVGLATDTAANVYVGDQTAPPGRVEVFACPQAALCGNFHQPCCIGDVTAQLPLCNGTLICDPASNTCVGKLSKP
jgi:hypothetical protein